jgi:hypothetical protein
LKLKLTPLDSQWQPLSCHSLIYGSRLAYCIALFTELNFRLVHQVLAKRVDLKILNDAVLTVSARHREGIDQAFGDAIAAIAVDAHANDFAISA